MADFGSLREFQDLEFTGVPEALATLGDKLEAALPADRWERKKDKEMDWPPRDIGGTGFVFARHADKLPGASVFVLVDGNKGRVSNIVPDEYGNLSFDEYNGILDDFLKHGVQPVAQALGVDIKTTAADRPLTDWLSEAAAKKLMGFSVAANKSSGASHPLDNRRWLEFLIQAHQDGTTLEAGTLRRWLIEIERWPDEQADGLAAQYDFSQDLLKRFSESRRSAQKL
jgi:hypothetical protein